MSETRKFNAGGIEPYGSVTAIWSEPTNNLRWNGGVLEHQFVLYGMAGKTLVGGSKEWRPIQTIPADTP